MENKQNNNPSRSELITDFVKTNSNYYIKQFQQIGSKPTFSFSFNFDQFGVDKAKLSISDNILLQTVI